MINYLGRYVPKLAETISPITELMKHDAAFCWSATQEQALEKVKELLTSNTVLSYYDTSKPTVVSADSSSYGLGAVLMQEDEQGLKPIAYASRALTPAEKKWAQIDKECLASVWACEKFAHFLVGLPFFRLMTDHKPLVPLINDKDLDKTPIRVQRLLMRLLRFNCRAEHVAGKNLVVADLLSRQSTSKLNRVDEISYVDVCEHTDGKIESLPVSSTRLQEIRQQTSSDPALQQVIIYTNNSWPEYFRDCAEIAKPFYANRDCFTTTDGLLLYLDRIVVPKSLQQRTLSQLHMSHISIYKTKDFAAHCVWWPTINSDIAATIKACCHCDENRPTNRHAPLKPTRLPDGPFQHIAADAFFFKDNNYLAIVDYYSRFPFLIHLTNLTTRTMILKFKNLFAMHGIPQALRTDGATCFTSKEFQAFLADNDIKHEVSSPHFSQSNGLAERTVQLLKGFLKQEDPNDALMHYRATPHAATGYTPAKLLFGREIRTHVPSILPMKTAQKHVPRSQVLSSDSAHKERMKKTYDKKHHVRPPNTFATNQQVRMKVVKKDLWQPATVVSSAEEPRSYNIKTSTGKTLRRNEMHLRPTMSQPREIPSKQPEFEEFYDALFKEPTPTTTTPDVPPTTTKTTPKTVPKVHADAKRPKPPTASRYGRAYKAPNRLDL